MYVYMLMYEKKLDGSFQLKKVKTLNFDVVVIGGGLSGICAAVASAREGAKTALVHERPVLGGNASEEIRMHVCGASCNMTKDNAEETGIIQELQLENKRINDGYNYSLWSAILLNFVHGVSNLTTFINTTMHSVHTEDARIQSVQCYQMTTEQHYCLTAKIFIDCTGNGTLGYEAGADFVIGSEAKTDFYELHAPELSDRNVMGNSLLFKAVDRGHPITFKKPDWAYHLTENQLKYRKHGNVTSLYEIDSSGEISCTMGQENKEGDKAFDAYCLDYGYWWIEIPGEIQDYEIIRDDLLKYVYGVWDHIKNGGNHGADNFELLWCGSLPGVRESRRLLGDYILNENDLLGNRIFTDAVAYGGWPVDVHTPGGLLDYDQLPNFIYNFNGLYTIPYRSYYSRNIENLFMAGRNISATRLAMSSSRVMGTCAVGGQAAGTAAGLCVRNNCSPRQLYDRVDVLQRRLIQNDCYIPGFQNNDPNDLARSSRISTTSETKNGGCMNLINGFTRAAGSSCNYWESNGLGAEGESVYFDLKQASVVSQVRIIFDSNLCRSIKITLSSKRMLQQQIGVPAELVKNYSVSLWKNGVLLAEKEIMENYLRLNIIEFEPTVCDRVMINITETNGIPNARIFEVSIYAEREITEHIV